MHYSLFSSQITTRHHQKKRMMTHNVVVILFCNIKKNKDNEQLHIARRFSFRSLANQHLEEDDDTTRCRCRPLRNKKKKTTTTLMLSSL
jgi:hypothetical protein